MLMELNLESVVRDKRIRVESLELLLLFKGIGDR